MKPTPNSATAEIVLVDPNQSSTISFKTPFNVSSSDNGNQEISNKILTKNNSNSNSGDSISSSVSDNKDIFEDKNNLPNSCFTIFKKGVENNFRLFLNYVGAKR